MDRKVSVLCSGGMDSVCLALWARFNDDPGLELHSLVFAETKVGAHKQEREAVNYWSYKLGVPVVTIRPDVDFSPATHWMRFDGAHNLRIVKGRNLAFVASAVAWLPSDVTELWVGATATDEGYPDCQPEFYEGLSPVIEAAYGVQVLAPFSRLTKRAMLSQFQDWPDDTLRNIVVHTWSCYQPKRQTLVWDDVQAWFVHCGECASCLHRLEAECWVLDEVESSLEPLAAKFCRS